MAVKGMNVEQVRNFASTIQNSTLDQLQQLMNSLAHKVQALDWQGQDADDFKYNRLPNLQQQFGTLRAALQELAQTASRNADAQEQTTAQG